MAVTKGASVGVGVVGCGLIGQRRAGTAFHHPRTRVIAVSDPDASRRARVREECGGREAVDWREVIEHPEVDLVAVATPNGFSVDIACAALAAGKHVLIEKPPGRNIGEAERLAEAARRAQRTLKIGFNHRYHPALRRMRYLVAGGAVGEVMNVRARYGHGGRPGYEREWRGDPALAGGGELTDQGVHLLDLAHWILGPPVAAFATLQTAVWPVSPLEDNGFAVLRYASGAVFSFHSSWTQWKNLFSFEVFGTTGAVLVEGLGGSYGTETLTVVRRRLGGGPPEVEIETFPGKDESWGQEWDDLIRGIYDGADYQGRPQDGVEVMRVLSALYQSHRSRREEIVLPSVTGGDEDASSSFPPSGS